MNTWYLVCGEKTDVSSALKDAIILDQPLFLHGVDAILQAVVHFVHAVHDFVAPLLEIEAKDLQRDGPRVVAIIALNPPLCPAIEVGEQHGRDKVPVGLVEVFAAVVEHCGIGIFPFATVHVRNNLLADDILLVQ